MRRTRLPILLLAGFSMVCLLQAGKKKEAPPEYSIVGGTVFVESGFALQGARVVVEANPDPGETVVKGGSLIAMSDARGEFAVRVPAAPMHYLVRVSAKSFQGAEQRVAVQGGERVDATFQLMRASN